MKNKQTQFLQQLGYTIEDITYKVLDDDDYIDHEVSLAYKLDSIIAIEAFKECSYHFHRAESQHGISNYVLETVYEKELENTLYEMAFEHVKRKNLINNFG